MCNDISLTEVQHFKKGNDGIVWKFMPNTTHHGSGWKKTTPNCRTATRAALGWQRQEGQEKIGWE